MEDGWRGNSRTEHHTKESEGDEAGYWQGSNSRPSKTWMSFGYNDSEQATLSSKNISFYISTELIYNRDWKISVFLSGTPRGLALTHGQDKGNEIYDVLFKV